MYPQLLRTIPRSLRKLILTPDPKTDVLVKEIAAWLGISPGELIEVAEHLEREMK